MKADWGGDVEGRTWMTTQHAVKSRTAIRGSIPSQKPTRHMIEYQGLVKRAYVYLLEYDSSVQSYEIQPFSLQYSTGTLHSTYTPDFRVQWIHQRPRLITCTSQALTLTPTSLLRMSAAQQWCQQHQHDFALITEVTLEPHTVLLANLQLLAVHAFAPIPAHIYDYMRTIFASIDGPFSPNAFIQYAPRLHPYQAKSSLWNLIYHGELLTDLTQPLHFAKTSLLWKHRLSSHESKRENIHLAGF
jgi:hypothetical protein